MTVSRTVTPQESVAVITGVTPTEACGWSLAARLSAHLTQLGVPPCLWKLDAKVGRFENGEGDLDLLVARDHLAALGDALASFGFRAARPSDGGAPGVLDYFAPSATSGRLLHLHVHAALLIGSADGGQIRIPMERAVLDAAELRRGLRVASPAHTVVLHVLHRTLRHSFRSLVRRREAPWIREEESLLEAMEARTDRAALRAVLATHLPMVGEALFDACRDSLRSGGGDLSRLLTGLRLRWRLRAFRNESLLGSLLRRLRRASRRVGDALRAAPPSRGRARPVAGGMVIALVGADGAGKSTSAVALRGWLGDAFAVRHLHLGRPPRGHLTLLCGALSKVVSRLRRVARRGPLAQLDDLLVLARFVCTARDRRRSAQEAHNFAARGGLAICERYPIDANDPLAGPSEAQGVGRATSSRLALALRRHERRIYAELPPADLTLVLRTDPETAVRRKHDEPSAYVRQRATLLWHRRWQGPTIRTIDAARPLPEVFRELRERIWERL